MVPRSWDSFAAMSSLLTVTFAIPMIASRSLRSAAARVVSIVSQPVESRHKPSQTIAGILYTDEEFVEVESVQEGFVKEESVGKKCGVRKKE